MEMPGGQRRVMVSQDDPQDLEDLMRAAQAGDVRAYTRFLGETATLVRRFVRSRVPNADDGEDLVQDVLLSLHTVRHTYDPGRPFLPWLMAIVRNRMADRMRRMMRRAAHEVSAAVLPETSAEVPTNTERGVIDERTLRRAIVDLPPGQRTAIEMLKLKEMSLKEAAAASGMSVGALKVATHRAIKTLRAVLGKKE
jgi:RNA polymerase sigma-70 factor (ECF subfamily)